MPTPLPHKFPHMTGLADLGTSIELNFEHHRFSVALERILEAVAETDGAITRAEPWKLATREGADYRSQLATSLYVYAESIRLLTALLYPLFL